MSQNCEGKMTTKQKVVASIEARMNSSRLPGKVMLKVKGKALLEIMIRRVQASNLIDEVIVATTNNPMDQPIVDLCHRLGVNVYRGSESDVLLRVLEAQTSLSSDIVVELTGDCPLIDPSIIDETIKMFLDNQTKIDYATSIQVPDRLMPDGMDVDVFRRSDLLDLSRNVFDQDVREHISPYFWQSGKYNCAFLEMKNKHKRDYFLSVTLDTAEDLLRISEVHEALDHKGIYSLEDILLYFDSKRLSSKKFLG